MGILLLIVPLLIYYVLIVPILKIKVINEMQSKKLKTLAFILLLLFPIGDHLIGYVVYKTLCYTKGGVTIYKTVTDEQEQRDYWFRDYISGGILTKKQYTPEDIKFDTDRESKHISVPLSNKVTFNRGDFATGYLNYCNPKYNTLPKTDPNYKHSCTNADEIIKKYNLKNVIKVPSSPYRSYTDKSESRLGNRIIPFLEVYGGHGYMKNIKKDEIIYEGYYYNFNHGWYYNTFNPYYNSSTSCNTKIYPKKYQKIYNKTKNIQELIIPNPYKIDSKGK